MRKGLIRLSLVLLALAAVSRPNTAHAGACPSHLTNGTIVCHLTGGTSCEVCFYSCDDGSRPVWNTCNVE